MSRCALSALAVAIGCLYGETMLCAQVPDFGPNVLIVDPTMPNVQQRLDAIFSEQEAGQFNDKRHAILFKPGAYSLDVQVGFYTLVAGLGASPDDVQITGAVRSKARWLGNNNATCNFWRAMENLSVTPTVEGNVNVWAVSQATAMRRVRVKGDLHLWDGGWSSGGFIADSIIEGVVRSGSQQQWLSRNADWRQWEGGNWNMVFVGVTNPPAGEWPEKPYTKIDKTPIVREKPFLFVDAEGRFAVRVPAIARDTAGVTWKHGETVGETIPVDRFHIARADRDTAETINAALDAGKHLLLTPGIYPIDASLRVSHPDTIVLGIGYPTLRVMNGTSALTIADLPGVKVAGVLIEAGPVESETLVRVGGEGERKSVADNPIVLQDLFCRAGGAIVGVTKSLVTIDAHHVVGDNFWLWRADHGVGHRWTESRNANGLIVNGDDVTIYGLFVEHTQEYQTLWNGERGRVYFYQSEMPYDPPSQEAWQRGGVRGYASYKVADQVTIHEAWGLGVYSYFTDAQVVADNAIEAPDKPGVMLRHLVTIRLGGKEGSGIASVINGRGESVITQMKSMVD